MKRHSRVLLVHPGIQHAPRLAEALEREGLLARFWTGWAHAGGAGGKRSVAIPNEKLKTRKWLEWSALILNRAGLDSERVWHWRNASFQKLVPDEEIEKSDVVIGFDTSSWILAKRAKSAKKKFFLEQSIQDPQDKAEALCVMARRYSDWAGEATQRAEQILLAERQEHTLADRISVPSRYVADSLIRFGVCAKKIVINPYGVNLLPAVYGKTRKAKESIRFLFAGTVCGRKGVPVLLEAWNMLGSTTAELTIAGSLASWPRTVIRPSNVKFTGHISRQEIARIFQENDVFVFPSYAEGMPLVVLEAMASGMAVIATPVVEGLIKPLESGILVPFGDPHSLVRAMSEFLSNPELAVTMGEAARKSVSTFSWEVYGRRYRKEILEEISAA